MIRNVKIAKIIDFSSKQKISKAKAKNTFWLISSAAVFIHLFILAIGSYLGEGDTGALINWTKEALNCLGAGKYSGCQAIGHFPMFQYIPTAIILKSGFSESMVFRVLSIFSAISFAGMILLFRLHFTKINRPQLFYLTLMIFISSPFLVYSRSSFGEMTAAFFVSLYVYFILSRKSWWAISIFALLSGLTKDINPPFLFVLGVAALFPELFKNPRSIFQQIFGVLSGTVLSMFGVAFFNFFRTGKPYNDLNMIDIYMVTDFYNQFNFFMGLWFSPNGGMIFFWSSFCFLIYLAVKSLSTDKLLFSTKSLPFWGIVLCLLALTYGLSRWWAPFGWIAWGPRLSIPLVPAMILLIGHFYGDSILISIQRLKQSKVLWGSLLAILGVLALAQWQVLSNPHGYAKLTVLPFEPHCPVQPYIENGTGYYFNCMWYFLWQPKVYVLVQVIKDSINMTGIIWSILWLSFLGGLLTKSLKKAPT